MCVCQGQDISGSLPTEVTHHEGEVLDKLPSRCFDFARVFRYDRRCASGGGSFSAVTTLNPLKEKNTLNP